MLKGGSKLSHYLENLRYLEYPFYSEYPQSPRQSDNHYRTITVERVFLHRRSPVPESEVDPYDRY